MGNITQLHQGSLNGLRRQTNECIDAAYNKGYEDGAKKQDEVQYQKGYEKGYEDGNKCLSDSELERIWENKLDKAKADGYDTGYDNGYNNGLKDVNHAMDVLKDMTGTECAEWFDDCVGVDAVVCGFSVHRIVEIIKAYEKIKKAEEEIKVGDEVKDLATDNIGVVMSIGKLIVYITNNGVYTKTLGSLEKTGRHFDEVEQMLNKLRGKE